MLLLWWWYSSRDCAASPREHGIPVNIQNSAFLRILASPRLPPPPSTHTPTPTPYTHTRPHQRFARVVCSRDNLYFLVVVWVCGWEGVCSKKRFGLREDQLFRPPRSSQFWVVVVGRGDRKHCQMYNRNSQTPVLGYDNLRFLFILPWRFFRDTRLVRL